MYCSVIFYVPFHYFEAFQIQSAYLDKYYIFVDIEKFSGKLVLFLLVSIKHFKFLWNVLYFPELNFLWKNMK